MYISVHISANQISWIQPRKMQKSLLENEGYKNPAKSDNQLPFRNEEAAKIDLFFRATNSRVPFNSSHEGGHKGISLK